MEPEQIKTLRRDVGIIRKRAATVHRIGRKLEPEKDDYDEKDLQRRIASLYRAAVECAASLDVYLIGREED